jgi:hypothetical protein
VTFPLRSRLGAIASVVLTCALVTAACSAPGASSGPTSTAGGSGSAACPVAPSVADDLEGWGPPTSAPPFTPVIIASAGELVCGRNRVLFTLLDAQSRTLGKPDVAASVAFYDLARDPSKAIATLDGTFVWAIENKRGIYVVNAEFPEAGRYGAEFSMSNAAGVAQAARLTFDVQPSSQAVKVGARAPSSKTPTLADAGGDPSKISTDASPDPDFYTTSVDQALAEHKPFVLVFATPKFCTSAQCGPTLDRIKPYAARYPTVTFINVEPYKLKLVDGVLQADTDAAGQLQTAPITDLWHLFSEPNVYVVDREGIVTANFELIFSDAELTAALDAVK